MLAVLAFYAQGEGKAGTHKWQSNTRTIGAISYLVTQVYKYAHHQAFRGVHQRNAALNVISYAHVPSDCFLCLLLETPSLSLDGCTLRLDKKKLRNILQPQTEIGKGRSGNQIPKGSEEERTQEHSHQRGRSRRFWRWTHRINRTSICYFTGIPCTQMVSHTSISHSRWPWVIFKA